jgi:hypothetical protein
MKKFLCLFMLAIAPPVVFANDFDCLFLDKIKLGNNFDIEAAQTAELPAELSDGARSNSPSGRIPSWWAFLVNVVAGAGIGSYIQGDILGGTVGLAGELGGIGLVWWGYFSIFDFSTGEFKEDDRLGIWLVLGGTAVLLGTRVFEFIRPWVYGRNRNYAFNFAPSVDTNGNLIYAASLNIKY